MLEITKKSFKFMHDTKSIGLVHSYFDKSKEECDKLLIDYLKKGNELQLIKLSQYSIANDGEISKTKVYSHTPFIYVETITDYSRDDTCSWNDTRINTVVYKEIN